jgi:hypothetical protein
MIFTPTKNYSNDARLQVTGAPKKTGTYKIYGYEQLGRYDYTTTTT